MKKAAEAAGIDPNNMGGAPGDEGPQDNGGDNGEWH